MARVVVPKKSIVQKVVGARARARSQGRRSRRETVGSPLGTVLGTLVAEAVVEAGRLSCPELDFALFVRCGIYVCQNSQGDDTPASPVLGARHVLALETLLGISDRGSKVVLADSGRLGAGPSADLGPSGPSRKVRFGFLPGDPLYAPNNADLAGRLAPVERERRVGVRKKFCTLARVVVCEKDEPARVHLLKEHDARRGDARRCRCADDHGLGLAHGGPTRFCCGLERIGNPGTEERQRVRRQVGADEARRLVLVVSSQANTFLCRLSSCGVAVGHLAVMESSECKS